MRARVVYGVLAFSFAFGSPVGLSQEGGPPITVLTNAVLIDGTGTPARPGMEVVLRGDRIASVHRAGSAERPAGAAVRDLSGRVLIPGLVDSHVHLMHRFRSSRGDAYAELQRMLYGGIVMAREMAGNARLTAEAARTTFSGAAPGPDLYFAAVMAGPQFFEDDPRPRATSADARPGSAPWSQAVTDDTDVERAVARAKETGATALKLYSQIAPPLLRRIASEAHRQGLKVWAHATVYPSRPLDVVSAGADSITHACGLAWQSVALDPANFPTPNMNDRPRFDPSLVDPQSAEMKRLFAEMKRRGTLFEPTLAIHLRPGDDQFGCTTPLVTALARAAHAAGVPISAGTDFVAPDADPYPALHRELEALVGQGVLTPLEAITAATRNGARAVGLEATHGTIEAGRMANLVVLEKNPAEDIRALRTVVAVVKRGRWHERADYVPAFTSQSAQEAK